MAEVKENDTVFNSLKIVPEVDAFPFKGLNISEDWEKLNSVKGRTMCAICKKSRKYFCYSCYVAVPEIQSLIPHLKLPVKIDIIKHAREMDGKSTAVHAAVLAPEHVRIFTYPCIPDYSPQENVVLIFPNKDAVSVEDVFERFMSNTDEPAKKRLCQDCVQPVIHRAVFIDSTWNQSRGIFKDPRIKALLSVVLKTRLSQFWRHQEDSPRWYLATIEAIHQFLLELDVAQWRFMSAQEKMGLCNNVSSEKNSDSEVSTYDSQSLDRNCTDSEIHNNSVGEKDTESSVENTSKNSSCPSSVTSSGDGYTYRGQYDNLLFFFRFMYSKIHTMYDHDQLKSYKRRLE